MEEKNCFKGTYQVQTVPNNNIDPLYKENFEPIRKALEEVGDKIDANEKASLETDLNDLKSLLESTKDAEMTEDQVSELKSKQEALMSKAQNLFTKMYENMQGAAGAAGPDMGGAQQTTQDAGNADDVVDGDYKEV